MPFKSAKKKIVVSNIENMIISFNTLKPIIIKKKNKPLETLEELTYAFFKNYKFDSKFSLFIIFYYLFNQPKDADVLINAS